MPPAAEPTAPPAPPETAAIPRTTVRRTLLNVTVTDDSRRHAVIAVQRALDRRDNGGAFGH
jgi:hypothetical protein